MSNTSLEAANYLQSLLQRGVAEVTHNKLAKDTFIDVTIEGIRFKGFVGNFGPYIVDASTNSGCELGSCTINHLLDTHGPNKVKKWGVFKEISQLHIDLSALSEKGRRALAVEFGLIDYTLLETALSEGQTFYASKAFSALVDWAKNNPTQFKKARPTSYLGNWPKMVKMSMDEVKPKQNQEESKPRKVASTQYLKFTHEITKIKNSWKQVGYFTYEHQEAKINNYIRAVNDLKSQLFTLPDTDDDEDFFSQVINHITNESMINNQALEDVMRMATSILKEFPDFYLAYIDIGTAALINQEPGEAKIWLERGANLISSVIPSEFVGQIVEKNDTTSEITRMFDVLVRSHVLTNKYDEAISAVNRYQQFLADGPYTISGPLYYQLNALTNDIEKATSVMSLKEADCENNHAYNLAYTYFNNQEYYKSITCLRHGILHNPLVAEMLLGNKNPREHYVYHQADSLEYAYEYMDTLLPNVLLRENSLFEDNEDDSSELFLDFLDWLYHSPFVLRERAEFHELLSQYLGIANSSNQVGFENKINEIDAKFEAINDESSMEIDIRVGFAPNKYIWEI